MMLLTLLVQAAAQTPATPAVNTRIGEPNAISVLFFFAFITINFRKSFFGMSLVIDRRNSTSIRSRL